LGDAAPRFRGGDLGGIGHPVGAVVAGILLGTVQEMSTAVRGLHLQDRDFLLVLLLALLLRPQVCSAAWKERADGSLHYRDAIITAIYVLLALGLNLQYGLTGLINFGHVGFFCVARTRQRFCQGTRSRLLAFPVAALLAALAAWPLGVVSLRLREDYFAIVSLGFSEVVRLVATSERWLTNGVQEFRHPEADGRPCSAVAEPVAVLALLVAVNLGAILMMRRIANSPFGRVIEAIRDNEEAVKSLGKDPAGSR